MDEAPNLEAAVESIALLELFLDLIYPLSSITTSLPTLPTPPSPKTQRQIDDLLSSLPPATQSAFTLLATLPIPREPLDELLAGFRTDLQFSPTTTPTDSLPIKTDADLLAYSQSVASSVAELCVRLVWANDGVDKVVTPQEQNLVIEAARSMGVALQLVNICRDVPADRGLGRSYLPGIGLNASSAVTTKERRRLLGVAKQLAREAGPIIDRLPQSARGGIRAACKVYLEIGEEVEKALEAGDIECRARVSGLKRVKVAWHSLRGTWNSL